MSDGTDSHTFECSLRHQDGRWLKFEVQHTHLLEDEHVQGIVLNSRDISERKAFEEQLSHQAFHDPVTGLANRALFADRVGHALRSTVRTGSLIAVMFIDLDDFKTINDSLGHQAGDAVLAEVAARLDRASRPSDTVARFGGDEFAILLDGVSGSDEAAIIGDRLLTSLEAPFDVDGQQVYPRASMGICMSDEDLLSQDAEELLRNADVAMYMAKRDTKGRYRLFEPAMHERVVERLELRSELQRALDEGQLEVYYQPVVRLSDGGNYGVEALLRWHHPTRGLVAPDAFIPLAEETGLILPIGRWVIDQACRKGAELQAAGMPSMRISVNLSVKQLQSESIVEDVADALRRTGLDAGVARARDHRDGDARGRRHGGSAAARAQGPRRADRDGRLRHGLLLAQLPEPAAGRHPEDGSRVPRRPRRRHRASPPRSWRSASAWGSRSSPRASSGRTRSTRCRTSASSSVKGSSSGGRCRRDALDQHYAVDDDAAEPARTECNIASSNSTLTAATPESGCSAHCDTATSGCSGSG